MAEGSSRTIQDSSPNLKELNGALLVRLNLPFPNLESLKIEMPSGEDRIIPETDLVETVRRQHSTVKQIQLLSDFCPTRGGGACQINALFQYLKPDLATELSVQILLNSTLAKFILMMKTSYHRSCFYVAWAHFFQFRFQVKNTNFGSLLQDQLSS